MTAPTPTINKEGSLDEPDKLSRSGLQFFDAVGQHYCFDGELLTMKWRFRKGIDTEQITMFTEGVVNIASNIAYDIAPVRLLSADPHSKQQHCNRAMVGLFLFRPPSTQEVEWCDYPGRHNDFPASFGNRTPAQTGTIGADGGGVLFYENLLRKSGGNMGDLTAVTRGFTKVPNRFLEALCRFGLSGPESSLVFISLRKIVGWHKAEDEIALSQFCKATKREKRTIKAALRRLTEMGILIIRHPYTNRRGTIWALELDPTRWKRLRGVKNGGSKSSNSRGVGIVSPRGGNNHPLEVRKLSSTKDNLKIILKKPPKESEIQERNTQTPIRLKKFIPITQRKSRL